ncbi:uncharacterized protein [Ambystoma mexicanum]|uniref:uncharacterized protein n=1 Tax=Ambystoma mexicanum TaxID=8296 RepID=UPI0037E808F5
MVICDGPPRRMCGVDRGMLQAPIQRSTNIQMLPVQRVTTIARIPTLVTLGATGCDLYVDENVIKEFGLVRREIQVELPEGTYGRVASMFGLALKHSLDVGAGVTNQDYRGEIKSLLQNFGNTSQIIKQGKPTAQLICEILLIPEIEEVRTLDSSEHGEAGFGEMTELQEAPGELQRDPGSRFSPIRRSTKD